MRPTAKAGGSFDQWTRLAIQLGHAEPVVDRWEWHAQSMGRAERWSVPKDWPTYGQLVERLVAMGYPPPTETGFNAWIAAESHGGVDVFLPASHRVEGRLFLLPKTDRDGNPLRLCDLTQGREGDLTDPDYHRLASFRRAEAKGYDGIVINDFCQSKDWGNVGHRSVGLFAKTLERMDWAVVPAASFDWPKERGGMAVTVTPEFERLFEERAANNTLTP